MFKLDGNNVGSDFEQIAKGEYEVYPTVFETKNSSTGNPMVTVNYMIRDDIEQPFKGREIRFDNFVFTETAMWRINQASKAAGLDMEKEYTSTEEWARDFIGKAIRVVVGHREYNGKTYAQVNAFKESEFAAPVTIDGVKTDDLPF